MKKKIILVSPTHIVPKKQGQQKPIFVPPAHIVIPNKK